MEKCITLSAHSSIKDAVHLLNACHGCLLTKCFSMINIQVKVEVSPQILHLPDETSQLGLGQTMGRDQDANHQPWGS